MGLISHPVQAQHPVPPLLQSNSSGYMSWFTKSDRRQGNLLEPHTLPCPRLLASDKGKQQKLIEDFKCKIKYTLIMRI
jgi:hypothetical protein